MLLVDTKSGAPGAVWEPYKTRSMFVGNTKYGTLGAGYGLYKTQSLLVRDTKSGAPGAGNLGVCLRRAEFRRRCYANSNFNALSLQTSLRS